MKDIEVKDVTEVNEDERRIMKAIFNGNFVAKQLLFFELKKNSELGGHYHDYEEIFYVIKGQLDYLLIEVKTGKKINFSVKEGQKIFIPAGFYHKAFAKKGTIFIGVTESEFISPEINNLPYKND